MTDQGRSSYLSRREVLTALGLGASALAISAATGGRALAATPGSNPGKYKADLGGYTGPELTSDQVTLRFMRQDFPPNVNAVFDQLYKDFSAAYPNITVREEKVPYGDLPNKVQVYVASGSAPDLMMGRNDFVSAYAAGDIAMPLETYFSAAFLDDMVKSLRDSATVNGHLYAMPWETNPVYMFFNKDIFQKGGVEPPPEVTDASQGWTADQFLDAMGRLTKALRAAGDQNTWALEASRYGNGGPGSNYTQLESIWVRSMGDPNADKNSSAYKTFLGVSEDGLTASGYLDAPEAIEGMTHYQALFTNGLTPKGAAPNQFEGGVAALAFGSINFANKFLSPGGDPGFKWGATPAPRGVIPFTANIADSPFVWSGTSNKNEASALLAFILNDENRVAFHREWGSMPGRQSLIAAIPDYTTKQPYQLAAAVAAASYGPPRSVGWFDYVSAINPAVKDIALGADPAQRLHDVAMQIDGLLAKYR